MVQHLIKENNLCHILIDTPFEKNDAEILKAQLQKYFGSFYVEFGKVYSVESSIVDLLYEAIYEQKKQVEIITHTVKLNNYFYKLGFKTRFFSIIKSNVVDTTEVEVLLIGGSADSSPKIKKIVESIHFSSLALVIVQHVEENKTHFFDAILQRYTSNNVSYAKQGEALKAGAIYIAPNNLHLKINNGCFELSDDVKHNLAKPSISVSYESFSNYYKEKLLIIQECGHLNDGVDKLQKARQNGSKIIIHKEQECEAKSMVREAALQVQHHFVFDMQQIVAYLNFLQTSFDDDASLVYFLELLFTLHGYDFSSYNRELLKRRIKVFMLQHDIKNLKNAYGMILFEKNSFKGFFLAVSINVTEMFRSPKSLQFLDEIIRLRYQNSHNVKFWSAGCSSGEEVYSLAILLDNLHLLDKSLIYATDFNDVVLVEAKNGLYSKKSLQEAEKNYKALGFETPLKNYFSRNEIYVSVSDKIRNKALFFKHNLILDSSFNEFDIIICQNVIIYFSLELQNTVFELLYNSLKFGGYLVLGKSEMLSLKYRDVFEKYNDDCKIFRKIR